MVQECVEAGEILGPRGCAQFGGSEVALGEIQIGFGDLLVQCQLKGVRAASRLVDLTQMVISCGFMQFGGNGYVELRGGWGRAGGVTGAPNCAVRT